MPAPVRPLPARALIGVVHLEPLPGSPASWRPLSEIKKRACTDAEAYTQAGFDAVVIENFGDTPFRPTRVDPHTVAGMTVIARAVRERIELPIGLNVLRNDPLAGLAIAQVCEAAFIRVNVHCGVYATDQGIIEGRADETLRYRQRLESKTAIFADVHVKHASPMLQQSIADAAAETAYRGRADGLIVTGTATGKAASMADLQAVRDAVPDRPLYVGSGTSPDNIAAILNIADGVIVGTATKVDGKTTNPVDPQRASALVQAAGK